MRLRKPYWAIKWKDRPFANMDLNREVIPPSTNIWHLEGAVCINCDDDFWAVALVPWSWRKFNAQEITARLWPETVGDSTVTFKPDNGDPWWDEYWKEDSMSIRAFDGPVMLEIEP